MPSKFRLRKIFRGSVTRVAVWLANHGVRPNTVTYFSLLLALIAFLVLVLSGSQFVFGIITFLVGFFDGVDGSIARLSNSSSNYGAFTDSFTDKVCEFIILFALAITFGDSEFLGISITTWAFVCFAGWIFTSYLKARAENMDVQDLDVGFGGRSERLFILVVFAMLQQLFVGLVVVTFVGITTAAYRFYHYGGQIREHESVP